MNYTRRIMLCAALFATGLHASNQALVNPQQINQSEIDNLQDPIALNIIKAMQECIDFNNNINWKLYGINAAKTYFKTEVKDLAANPGTVVQVDPKEGILVSKNFDNSSKWTEVVALYHKYMNDLRQKYNDIKRPELTILPEISRDADLKTRLSIQANQCQFLFDRLLDEYVAHLGQVYEKKSGLLGFYRPSYYISSRNDQSLAITPNEYTLLVQTLDNAAKQDNWGQDINLNLIVMQENGSTTSKSLTLNEIIIAIKQVPLPVQYSTAAKIGAGVVAAAAIGAGAYVAYHASKGQLVTLPGNEQVEQKINIVEKEFNAPTTAAIQNNQAIPLQKNSTVIAPTTENLNGWAGLKKYVHDVEITPDFDNQISPDVYIKPGALEEMMTHPIAETLHLPIDIKNRTKIAWENLHDPAYKTGYSVEKYVDRAEDPDHLEAYTTPDEGDLALQNSAVAVATTVAITPPYTFAKTITTPLGLQALTSLPLDTENTTTGAVIGATIGVLAGSRMGPAGKVAGARVIGQGHVGKSLLAGGTIGGFAGTTQEERDSLVDSLRDLN